MSEQQTDTTLRERAAIASAFPKIPDGLQRWVATPWSEDIKDMFRNCGVAVIEEVLAEIERRCAERGYTHLISAPHNWRRNMGIADFIAELRGEVTSDE